MVGEVDRPEAPELLLQREAAARLRCTEQTVKKLRLSGQLAYIPGNPVRILASDIEAFIARKRKPTLAESQAAVSVPEQQPSAAAQSQADALRAKRYWLKHKPPKLR